MLPSRLKRPPQRQEVAPEMSTDKKKKKRRKRRRKINPAVKGKPGRLRLATSPWTTIYLKGEKLGVTPLVDVELPAGRHSLRAVNLGKGIDRKIQVVIRSGQTTAKSVRF